MGIVKSSLFASALLVSPGSPSLEALNAGTVQIPEVVIEANNMLAKKPEATETSDGQTLEDIMAQLAVQDSIKTLKRATTTFEKPRNIASKQAMIGRMAVRRNKQPNKFTNGTGTNDRVPANRRGRYT